ncbi:MAG: HupE/UreJ family protein [Myxococcota bacterium]
MAHDLWRCGPDASVRLLADPSEPPLVLEVVSPDGVRTAVLDAAHPRASLSAPADGLAVFGQWLGLGVEHLATGLDHVLLVLGLCALIGFRARLIAALTAFTLGHSLSLALAATGLVTLPPAAVEVAIAATLVLLGLELATRPAAPGRARPGPLARWPWAGGVAIGLVHGLGFAAALRALGLPDAHVGGALVGFNLGLELAQLAFVAALGLAVLTARRLARGTTRWPIASAAGWLIGIAGAAWVLDRALP